MNSKLDEYLDAVLAANEAALKTGKTAIARSIPCFVCRELEAPQSDFVDSSDPFMTSYRALSRNQHVVRAPIPRKIEFESAVYLREGIIDRIFPNSPVTLLFVGDGLSDKRFSYNCQRLFRTFGGRYQIRSFICNPDLAERPFGPDAQGFGWDASDDRLFYHARTWDELPIFLEVAADERRTHQVLVVVDFDGTYLCPRPTHNSHIKEVRREAIVSLSNDMFDNAIFDSDDPDHVQALGLAYAEADATGFCRGYEDEDLTMLVALGLYARIIGDDDALLNPANSVGFTLPIEWLQYASFLIDNSPSWERPLRQLRALYTRCADDLRSGSPTAFAEFRKREHRCLVSDPLGEVVLNRAVTSFLIECARLECVPIGFSDRPNASLGLESTNSPACTAVATADSLLLKDLDLTPQG